MGERKTGLKYHYKDETDEYHSWPSDQMCDCEICKALNRAASPSPQPTSKEV